MNMMNNLNSKTSDLTLYCELETEKMVLLQDFEKVALSITPGSGLILEIGRVFLREISLNLTRLLQRLGYNKRKLLVYKEKGKSIILNIGSYEFIKDTFINTDILPSGKDFLKLIIGKHVIKNNMFLDITTYDKYLLHCADGIVLSHVLEHIPPTLAITALRHCFDYLKPGGCIRITVPYLGAYDQIDFPEDAGVVNRMLAKNWLIYGWGHKFMYDAEILALLMQQAEFSEVKEVAFGEGLLHETDNADKKFHSIYLTGVKI
jgi:SAM-dependent methyltransferase